MPRIAVIDKERCNPQACGNYLCIRLCPVNKEGKECIVVGEDKKALIYENMCTGCGICVNRCPFNAITIVNLPDELTSKPLHQYDINSFRLYNMAVPKNNTITGLLGRNGMGKSTLMNIMSGQLIPNLGDYENDASWKSVIEHFRGSEAQKLFTDLSNSTIRPSLKPQLVEKIPEVFSGTVEELLKGADISGRLDELSKALQLNNIMKRSIKDISGGELQRVAIAASMLKDANLLLVDEPSSYLDIKQRINAARLLNSEKERKPVITVEHDLVVLDYMADNIHVSFGKPKAYGIISLPRAAKNGINSYLQGHLREENIRTRDTAISFRKTADEKTLTRAETLFSWDEIDKSLKDFSLKVSPGKIRKKEVVGIVGENGIGKSTFVKVIAGELESDGGELTEKLAVSYKPQYLPAEDIMVSQFIPRAFEKYQRNLILPLELSELEFRNVSSLSGGELQRVWIAKCLSEDADIYLLDEPSAYLDVEQRLAASKAIRQFIDENEKSALIVDHDLLMVDFVSDSIMVFSGQPSQNGRGEGPFEMRVGLNRFLKSLDITVRRDEETGRPRINKPGSVLDRKQKDEERYYA